jgi:hypothetical protein
MQHLTAAEGENRTALRFADAAQVRDDRAVDHLRPSFNDGCGETISFKGG